MSAIDLLICALYIVATMVISAMVSKRQKNTEDFFLAGRGMKWWPVAISLFASLFSAISYIAMPAEGYNFGCTMLLSQVVAVVSLPVMMLVYLRFFYHMRLTTINEYFERRFSVGVRLLSSIMFLIMRLTYLGVVLYATAMLLDKALGWPAWLSITVVGIFCTIYTCIGGMEAVIWTDVMQFFVLLGGILLVIGIIAWQMPGGIFGIWEFAAENGRTVNLDSTFWDIDMKSRINVWPWLIGLPFAMVTPATDQINLQRCLSCNKFSEVIRAVCTQIFVNIPICFIFYFAGLAIFAYFKFLRPELDPNLGGDMAFCHYITNNLPVGLRGILSAGILAAVMSTVDSVENSLSAVFTKDIYARLIRPGRSEEHYLKAAKITTAIIGISTCLFGLSVLAIYGNREIPLLEVSQVTLGVLGSFGSGIVMLALLTKRTNGKAMLIGAAVAVIPAFYFTVFRYILPPPEERMGFMFIGMFITFPEMIVAYIASFFVGKNPEGYEKYVIWSKEAGAELNKNGRSWAKWWFPVVSAIAVTIAAGVVLMLRDNKSQAETILFNQLRYGDGWKQVHAAEALLETGADTGEITEIFKQRLEESEPASQWRVGCLRVLYRTTPGMREEIAKELAEMAMDEKCPAVHHAVETMGKLAIIPDQTLHAELKRRVNSEGMLGGYARMALAAAGDAEARKELAIRAGKGENDAAFAFYYIGKLTDEEISLLKDAATSGKFSRNFMINAFKALSANNIICPEAELLLGKEDPDLIKARDGLLAEAQLPWVRKMLNDAVPAHRILAAGALLKSKAE